jgi:hypothetical protein
LSQFIEEGQGMKKSIGRRTVLGAAGGIALGAPAVRAQAGGGVALVIGNSKYQWEAPLPNVRRDAPDIAKRFQEFGLRTELVQDAGRDAMRAAVEKFAAAARGANFAALYFAGHGAAWGKDTYLVSVDADLGNPDIVKTLVPVNSLYSSMEAANARLMVFDNCRNNPADGWRQREAEQAAFIGDNRQAAPTAPNSLVLYSTAPGRVALDGPAGDNSPFAASLLRQFSSQSVDLGALPAALRRDVLIATSGRQVVFSQSTVQGSFPIAGAPAKGAAAANRSGWASDPSKIIELTRTYAFSNQHDLRLPPGLVSHRAPAGTPHANKAGAFSFDNSTPDGKVPGAIIILSVEEQAAAEVVFITRLGGKGGWRFVRPTLTNDTMTYETRGPQGPRFVFKWTDANSGTVTQFAPERSGRPIPPSTSKFTRLD